MVKIIKLANAKTGGILITGYEPEYIIPDFDLENAAISAKQKNSGYNVFDFPNSIFEGPFCWISSGHQQAFWHNRASQLSAANRHLGYHPLNYVFPGSQAHHIFLENNTNFCIHIPGWLHELYTHTRQNPDTLLTINSIALDFWINEELYMDLFEIKKYQLF